VSAAAGPALEPGAPQVQLEPASGAHARPRLDAVVWTALALILGGSLFVTVHPWYDLANDGSMYIASARALAAGEGYRYLEAPFTIRPPGYPLLIAPLFAWRGTDFYALNLWTSVLGALGVLAFHCLARARLGALAAGFAALVLWFAPGYQRLCNQVMSDAPGWTALVACLLLARRVARNERLGPRLGLGLAIGAATLVRTGNLLLVPALAAAWLFAPAAGRALASRLGNWLRASLALGLGAALLVVPWELRNRAVAPPPPADQTLLYSYSSGMWHTDMGDPRSPRVSLDEVLARVPEQGAKLLHTLGTGLGEGPRRAWTLALAWTLIGALVVQALRRRGAEELFALATLAVVAIYFGYAGRLLLPVFGLALLALLELLREGCARVFGARVGAATAALVALTWLVLDWRPRAHWAEIETLHRAFENQAAAQRAELGPNARLGAWRGWHHAVYLDLPVFSFEHACKRAASLAPVEELIERYRIDAVLLGDLGLPSSVVKAERVFADHVVRRYGPPRAGLVRVR
jgi:hypothetical protein